MRLYSKGFQYSKGTEGLSEQKKSEQKKYFSISSFIAWFVLLGFINLSWADQCNPRPPAPEGSVCGSQKDCMLDFAGYKWWTNYPFNLVPNQGYWLNGQQWDPRLASVDSNGLNLEMKKTLLPHAPGKQWSSVEVMLWSDSSGKRVYPGYGKYLVAASTPKSFGDLSKNGAFGAFTYRTVADPSQTNSHHELDMIEASRWGNPGKKTNAQFTLQPWEALGTNVHRITLKEDTKEITLLMDWPGEGVPVTFSVFYGLYSDISSLPKTPNITWTTASDQNKFIPKEGCQTVHLNLWRQPPGQVTPDADQKVTVHHFQYSALKDN